MQEYICSVKTYHFILSLFWGTSDSFSKFSVWKYMMALKTATKVKKNLLYTSYAPPQILLTILMSLGINITCFLCTAHKLALSNRLTK